MAWKCTYFMQCGMVCVCMCVRCVCVHVTMCVCVHVCVHVCCVTAFSIDSVEVVKASGECLRAVLLTKTGAGVLSKLEGLAPGDSWCAYLEPFKPGKKKKVLLLWRQRTQN